MSFTSFLKDNGWNEVQSFIEFRKNNWITTFDTSSWMEISSDTNERIFDVPVPDEGKELWTLKSIEHLCYTDDKLNS